MLLHARLMAKRNRERAALLSDISMAYSGSRSPKTNKALQRLVNELQRG